MFKYRKRNITNYFIIHYEDDDCLRTIRVHGVGTSFGMLEDGVPLKGQPGAPAGQFHISRVFVDFDRFEITWTEKPPVISECSKCTRLQNLHFHYPKAHMCKQPRPCIMG